MNFDEKTLREIITKVVNETLKSKASDAFVRRVDASGIIKIESQTVTCEPFGDTQGVYLRDIVTLEEAPRMGAGIMELDHANFEWTLSYDEYDYVIDGQLEIEIDNRVISGKSGDIIYIPKGSHIHFKTPSTARFAYFVYPADWQNQQE